MQAENNGQVIDIAARRRTTTSTMATTPTTANQPISPERKAAYRHFALTVLGLDVQTLTTELRARRLQREAPLRLVTHSDRAA